MGQFDDIKRPKPDPRREPESPLPPPPRPLPPPRAPQRVVQREHQPTLVGPMGAPPAVTSEPPKAPFQPSLSPPPGSAGFKVGWDPNQGLRADFRSKTLQKVIGWIFPALLGAGGGAVTSKASDVVTPQVPPAVLECPAQVEGVRGDVSRLRSDTTRASSDADEAFKRTVRLERRIEQLTEELEAVKKATPRIEGVAPTK